METTWDTATSDLDWLTSNPWSLHPQDLDDSAIHPSSSSRPSAPLIRRGSDYVEHNTTGKHHHRHTHTYNGAAAFVPQGQVINIERSTGLPIIILIPPPSHSTHHVHRA
ncbi:hypothetical protein D9611_010764 [Ephemerocybe angulata]|uniref:Uncharacterized protein n=1 Tax=Ephemerocybe angulata TaxID=980116 RepID=A0A8H5BCN6_9AGAR|nr:hypothetical protein D9611_010764 [Tulosesus angulatus]